MISRTRSLPQYLMFCLLILFGCVAFHVSAQREDKPVTPKSTEAALNNPPQINQDYGRLPLRFEANKGQFGKKARFVARSNGLSVALSGAAAIVQLQNGSRLNSLSLKLLGANSKPMFKAEEELPGLSHYFIGDTRQTNVISYARVRQRGVYPGIDMVWYGNNQQIEHDFVVAPGANPEQIKFEISGAEGLHLSQHGDLVVCIDGAVMRLQKPVAWQELNGTRLTIPAQFQLSETGQVSFELGDYDVSQTLVIDPILVYSTLLAGGNGLAITVDQAGFAYVAGSANLPQLVGPITLPYKALTDVFVTKLNRTGTAVIFTAYLGGSIIDTADSVGVDAAGNVYVAGTTSSNDFPKTTGRFAGEQEAFITKLNPAGNAIVYSHLLGGGGVDEAFGLAVTPDGNAFITGRTNSGDLPANGFQSSSPESLVFKSTDGGTTWSSAILGPSGNRVNHIAVTPSNPNIVYAATNAGFFKSLDGGNQWQLKATFAGQLLANVSQIALHPSDPAVIFVATDNGPFLSTDAGETFTLKDKGIEPQTIIPPPVYAIAFNPITPTTVYAAASGRFYRSQNAGEAWSLLNSPATLGGLPDIRRRLAIAPTTPLSLYYSAHTGLYKSVDGVFDWTFQLRDAISDFVIHPQIANTVYAGLGINAGGMLKTIDGGMNWVPVNNGLLLPGGEFPARSIAMAIDPISLDTLYLSTTSAGLYKTQNGGENWSPITNTPSGKQVHAWAVDPITPSTIFAGATKTEDAFVAKFDSSGALSYLTYLGGAGRDTAHDIAVDSAGNAYIAGVTASPNFPIRSAFQTELNGPNDAFITKLNASGTDVVYSAYLGGEQDETAFSVAVNSAGNAFVAGTTNSFSWPTVNPLVSFRGGNNAFVARLSANGQSLDYSSILGGSGLETATGIDVSPSGEAYVTGWTTSNNFPVKDAVQTTRKGETEAFVTAINAAGDSLVYSTCLGSPGPDAGADIAVDSAGNAYVVGSASFGFPLSIPPPSMLPPSLSFITKIGAELDLALSQTISRNPVMIGNNLTYTFGVINRGPSISTGTTLTVQLTTGVNIVSTTSTVGSCTQSANVITCNLGSINVMASATVTLVVNSNTIGNIVSIARLTSNEPEFDASDNQASQTVRVSNLPSIAGRIADASGKAISGITLNLTGSQTASQVTDANGFYQFADVALGGSFVVRPASNLFSLEPESRSFNNVASDQSGNFAATACTYTLSANNQSFDSIGGNSSFIVTAPPRCPWTATPTANWINISSVATGSGNGQVTFAVAPTTTSARNARISLADQNFVIYQELNSCPEPRFGIRTYSLTGQTFSMLAADLTGDGRADLVASGQLFKGNGDGSFAKPVTIPSLAGNSIATDLNADGSPDLAFINNSEQLSVLFNNGSGIFSAPQEFDLRTGLPPEAQFRGRLLTGQFNQDKAPDIIIGYSIFTPSNNIPTTGVIILLNDGAGRFGSPIRTLLNSYHLSGVADLTGDGLSDLMATSNFPSERNFRVFPATGDASFGVPLSISADGEIRQTEFNDFNGDGKTDVALHLRFEPNSTTTRNYVAILLGDGKGQFSVSDTTDINLNVARIFVGDFNNDAKLDVLALGRGEVTCFRGDGTGKLATGFDSLVFPNFDSISASAMADFNLDGRPDFAKANSDRMNFSVHLNRCANGNYVSGRITDRLLIFPALTGITVKLSGTSAATTQTDDGGNYEFGGLATGGNFTVTPEQGGFEFAPDKQSFTNLIADQIADFTGVRQAVAVSAASFKPGTIAPDSIASIFGIELAGFTSSATGLPLPLTLGNTLAVFRASSGFQRTAPLFFVSPGQINLMVPGDLPLGRTSITVGGFAGTPFSLGSIELESVVPGLFSADATGQGLAAAVALRIRRDGSQIYEPVTRFGPAQNRIVAVPIDLSNTDEQVILLLFGTGFRKRGQTSISTIMFGGVEAELLYAGAQGDFAGLDQVNVNLPRSLTGRGEVDVLLTVEGKSANPVKVAFK